MGLWLAAPYTAHGGAEPLSPHLHRLSPTHEQGKQQCPSPIPWLTPWLTSLLPAPTQPLSFPTIPCQRTQHQLAAGSGEGPCPTAVQQAGRTDTKAGCRPRVAGASSPPQRWLWRFFRQTSMRDTVKLYVHWSGSMRFLQGTQQVRGAQTPQQPQTCQRLCIAHPWPPGSRDLANTNPEVALAKQGGNPRAWPH